ncbi:WD repeat-containing protein 75-like [Hibiscus syriacus]|uniref:non-specific serine/threonine protein kinase n=1 Tax=Hibiscus syriacus TaxID=106335 RepID=A0A6A3CNT5_HIBSY|nr:WD repeat-containing protein 75-like [Hibiscus syriacus]
MKQRVPPMKYIRANSLKRLFSSKRRSFEDGAVDHGRGVFEEEDKDGILIATAAQRPSWKCFSFEEIFFATNAFSSDNLVGKGGYAEVYRGVLNNGEEIAVKRLTKTYSDERKEKDFLTEIGTIGHFSSLGSVASRLHDANSPPIDWKTRYKIAIGTAKGLHYLHKVCQRRIIHRDIKSSNILLTADFEPQISDSDWRNGFLLNEHTIPLLRLKGHSAPEYFMHGTVDEKTDVFAFGVFLLEIISGRKPVNAWHQSLHCWAKPLLNREEMEKLVDPRLLRQLAAKATYVQGIALHSSVIGLASNHDRGLTFYETDHIS